LTMSLRWSEESLKHESVVVHGALSELGNAVLAVFWAGEKPRLGTMTATLPDGTSSPLLGERDEVLSKIIGGKLASGRERLALVSVNLPPDWSDGRPLMELTKRLIGETDE
jgi:hypothetical protein